MLELILVLPLTFASPQATPLKAPAARESVVIVSRVTVCTDEKTGASGHCLIMMANQAEMIFFFQDGSLQSITAKTDTFTYTIWER